MNNNNNNISNNNTYSKKKFNTPYIPEFYPDEVFQTLTDGGIQSRIFINMLLWFMEKKFGFLEDNKKFGKLWYEKYIDFTGIKDLEANKKDKGFQTLKYDCEFCDRVECTRETCLKYDAFWLMIQFILDEVDKDGYKITTKEGNE